MSISENCVGPAMAAVVIAIALAVVQRRWDSRHRHLPYPPGPKGYPIIGNILDFPETPIWEGFVKMAKEHNTDILHLDVMGSHLIVLSNSHVAMELLERRSAISADRPRLVMVNELLGCSWSFAVMRYGDLWRIHRRLFHRFFNGSAANQFDDKVHKAVCVFLRRLAESPEHFMKHAHFLAGSLTLSIAYGVNVESEDDVFFSAADEAMSIADRAMMPGGFLVDAFPVLRYLPEWFPGASFNRFARIAKEKFNYSVNLSFQHVKESFEAGTLTTPSIVATCLEELPELAKRGVDEDVIRGMSGTVYLGGEETTSSAIKSFFLAATLYPEIVRLGQQELDEVLGGERLPDFTDKSQLPYISAVLKEVLRWRPPTAIGSPHLLMEDVVYEGQLLPAGATILDNTWAIFRDELAYPNAHIFDPGRFLKDGQINPDVKDPEELLFGYGRRVCPGKYFSLRVLFLTIASTLATFDISKCLDEDGNPIVPEEKYSLGLISNPLPFRSSVIPRSARALSLIAEY